MTTTVMGAKPRDVQAATAPSQMRAACAKESPPGMVLSSVPVLVCGRVVGVGVEGREK